MRRPIGRHGREISGNMRWVLRGVFRRSQPRRWLVRLYDPPSGRADYFFVAARDAAAAERMVASFIEYTERGRADPHLTSTLVVGEPGYGDLGATPLRRSGQAVRDIRRWHAGGADLGGYEPAGPPLAEADIAVVAAWRSHMGFDP